jgi:large subunit ribosomal protein L36e
MESRTGIVVGLNKGFVVSKPTQRKTKTTRKGKLGKRVQLVRDVIREVAGFAPYEKKMMEMIRTGIAAKEKKAVKMARARLGTHRRAQFKRDEMQKVIASQRKK